MATDNTRLLMPDELKKKYPAPNIQLDPALFNPRTAEQQRVDKMASDFDITDPSVNPETARRQAAIDNATMGTVKPLVASVPTQAQQPTEAQQVDVDWQKLLTDALAYRENAYQEDERAQKAEKSRRRIGALADAIAGVANMWGVSRGAYNQQNPATYNLISQRILQDTQLRQRNIANADRRVADLYNQIMRDKYKAEEIQNDKDRLAYNQSEHERKERQGDANISLREQSNANSAERNAINREHNQQMYDLGIYKSDNQLKGTYARTAAQDRSTEQREHESERKAEERQAQQAEKERKENNKSVINDITSEDKIGQTRRELAEIKYGKKYDELTSEEAYAASNWKKSDIESMLQSNPAAARKYGYLTGSGSSSSISGSGSSKPNPGSYKGGANQSDKDKINGFRGRK